MEKMNKRDIILIVSIILIVAIVAVIIIIPKNRNNNNETINKNNSGDIVANSPASPEELFSRPIDTNTLPVSNEVSSENGITSPSNQGITVENSDLGEIVNTTLQ